MLRVGSRAQRTARALSGKAKAHIPLDERLKAMENTLKQTVKEEVATARTSLEQTVKEEVATASLVGADY
jgi:hypothetical protein